MSLWMVRGDKYGQQQDMALYKGIAHARFIEVPDLRETWGQPLTWDTCCTYWTG